MFQGLAKDVGASDGVSDMAEARTYYDYDYHKRLAWSFTREQIGRDLRERYEVQELPLKLRSLVRKLDDRDWLFPSVSRENDTDLFGG
jgi:hypothetical protein